MLNRNLESKILKEETNKIVVKAILLYVTLLLTIGFIVYVSVAGNKNIAIKIVFASLAWVTILWNTFGQSAGNALMLPFTRGARKQSLLQNIFVELNKNLDMTDHQRNLFLTKQDLVRKLKTQNTYNRDLDHTMMQRFDQAYDRDRNRNSQRSDDSYIRELEGLINNPNPSTYNFEQPSSSSSSLPQPQSYPSNQAYTQDQFRHSNVPPVNNTMPMNFPGNESLNSSMVFTQRQ